MTEILIRAIEMSDIDDINKLQSMPKSRRETLQLPYQSLDFTRKKFENPPENQHSLVAVVKETQKVVGLIGLFRITRPRRSHVGQIGMAVHDDYHNQGIGSKMMEAILNLADNWLNLKRLELEVYVDNKGAIHLYEKYGFVIEGTLRKFAFRDGDYVDAYEMGRVRE